MDIYFGKSEQFPDGVEPFPNAEQQEMAIMKKSGKKPRARTTRKEWTGTPEKIISSIFQKCGNAMAMEIMDRVRKNGCKFAVCPPCTEYFSAKGGDKYYWLSFRVAISS
jgi:hypothetical protein